MSLKDRVSFLKFYTKFIRIRFLPFLIDWLVWAYLLYGGFTLHYLATKWVPWRPEEKFVLPELSSGLWAFLLFGLVEFMLLLQSFGFSLGQRALGVWLRKENGLPPTILQRVRYFLWSQVTFLPAGLGVWLSPQRSWAERAAGLALMPLPPHQTRRRPWYLSLYGVTVFLFLGLTLALGWRLTEVSLKGFVENASRSLRIWRGIINPDMRYLLAPDPGTKYSFVDGLVESLFMALLATVGGATVAFPLSFLGARNITARNLLGWLVYGLTRGFFNVFRSVESIYWAAIFAIWVGFGPFAGTVALFIHTVAALGKLFSEQVEHIDPGPVEALTATGAHRLQVVRYAVVPQVVPQFLAFTIYRWDINLRMATVVALVGGGGIGRLLFEYKDDIQWYLVGGVIVCFVSTIWLMDYVSGWIRERIS